MKKVKDTALIQDIKRGDKKAERKLYDKYKKKLTDFLTIRYPKTVDKEDDVSEILIKIFEKIPTYDETKSNFGTWVISIAKNHMIDKARKNENNPIHATLDSLDGTLCFYNTTNDVNTNLSVNTSFTTTTSFFSPPNEDLENRETLSFISNKIGLKDFHLLNMKYNEGYDYKEMEKEMGVSSSTLSNRINYVKGRLKK